MLDLYFKASYELHGDQATRGLGKVPPPPLIDGGQASFAVSDLLRTARQIFNKVVRSVGGATPRSGRIDSEDKFSPASPVVAKKPGILKQLRSASSLVRCRCDTR